MKQVPTSVGGYTNGNEENFELPRYLETIENKNIGTEKLVYKFPFFNFLFKEPIISDWPFSKRILVTAYDLYKDDGFVTQLNRTGSTLKEYLQDNMGFNQNIAIFADTGIFELEARKAKVDFGSVFGNEILPKLSNQDIFYAYDLIDPDFLVAPDEIILLEDNRLTVDRKLEIIEQNLYATIDRFPRSKIFATIQGIERVDIEKLVEIVAKNNITKIARGGILPLRRSSREDYYKVLQLTEEIAKVHGINYIHAFGLSSIRSIGDYFIENSYDSLDTSAIYWITARRRYIKPSGDKIPVRNANLKACSCKGCEIMKRSKYWADTSGRFAIGLYYHNAQQFAKIVTRIHVDPQFAMNFRPYMKGKSFETNNIAFDQSSTKIENKNDDLTFDLITANQIITSRKSEGDHDIVHRFRLDNKMKLQLGKNVPRSKTKILLITNCSKRKKKFTPPHTKFNDICQLKDRELIYEKFFHLALPAKLQYQGSYRDIINRSMITANQIDNVEFDEIILSGGYGIIKPTDNVVPYDLSFNNRTNDEIEQMVEYLQIEEDLRHKLSNNFYDIIISTLSTSYQHVISKIIRDCIVELNFKTELVWFTKTRKSLQLDNWMIYGIDEFYYFHKSRKPMVINPGRNWHSRSNIFYSYVRYLKEMRYLNINPENTYFFDFWHYLFDCSCEMTSN